MSEFTNQDANALGDLVRKYRAAAKEAEELRKQTAAAFEVAESLQVKSRISNQKAKKLFDDIREYVNSGFRNPYDLD